VNDPAPAPTLAAVSRDDPESGVRRRDARDDRDGSAFAAFVTQEMSRIEEWARMMRIPVQDAEDIAQSALLSLWKHRGELEASWWPGWFWKAMLLRGRQYRRDGATHRQTLQEHESAVSFLLQQRRINASPEVLTYLRECESYLLGLVNALHPDRREVVRLYLLEEVEMDEVAARLGLKLNTAKDRWLLARADMRADFERDRAKERSALCLAAMEFAAALLALHAFFSLLWRRLRGQARGRAVPLLACAALVLVVTTDDGPASALLPPAASVRTAVGTLRDADEDVAPPAPSPLRYAFLPILSAQAERVREAAPVRASSGSSEVPRKLLLAVEAAVQDGRLAQARTLLQDYRLGYPSNPFPQQYARLAREAASR
jgi:RNA polymerase sigma factor (sigma-70 family)